MGASTLLRTHGRVAIASFVVGVVALSSALAGIVVSPGIDDVPDARDVAAAAGLPLRTTAATTNELDPADVAGVLAETIKAPDGARTPAGTFLVGAARVDITPTPLKFGGETWQTEGCTSLDDQNLDRDHAVPNPDSDDPIGILGDIRGWPAASPDCVYLGGFGIGPARPAKGVGHGGVWIRALAVSNGEETFIYEIADLVGWFARYDSTLCVDCGIRDVRSKLATDLGIDMEAIMAGSTHSHATADSYGGWGGIPKWYRTQIRDSAIAAAKQAVANLVPATLHSGELHTRTRNNERRDHYYSTVDTGMTWLQARTLPVEGDGCAAGSTTLRNADRRPRPDLRTPTPTPRKKKRPRQPTPTPASTPDSTPTGAPSTSPCAPTSSEPQVVATVATFGAHPTIVGDPVLHADWPGATARHFETLYGGVGLTFEGGLGNASISGIGSGTEPEKAEATGIAIASDVASDIERNVGRIASNDMVHSVDDELTHPTTTNIGLVTLASVGLMDREFTPGTPGAGLPGAYHWSKGGPIPPDPDDPPDDAGALRGCDSVGPTVITTAGAHRIGDTVLTFAPGEIFSNIAEVLKESRDNNRVLMPTGQMNDALGYIIQSFEFDLAGNVVTEYGTMTGEYEEVFAIDRCFGDHVLQTLLTSAGAVGGG